MHPCESVAIRIFLVKLLIQEDPLPFDPGFLKIDEPSHTQTLVGKGVHALQFHDHFFLDYEIGHIFAHVLPLVTNRK